MLAIALTLGLLIGCFAILGGLVGFSEWVIKRDADAHVAATTVSPGHSGQHTREAAIAAQKSRGPLP